MKVVALLVLTLGACGPKAAPEPAAAPVPAASVLPASVRAVDPVEANTRAVALIASGSLADLEQAVTLLTNAVNQDPSFLDARINLGVAQQLRGDLTAARGHYQAVIDADPTKALAWQYLGAVRERQLDLGGAVDAYRSGLAQAPEDMALHAALIAALRKQKKYSEAVAAAKVALGVNANDIAIYNNFGLVYLEEGNLTLARFIFQKALQLPEADKNAYIHCNLGWVSFLDGNVYQATQELKKAVELDPELVPALIYLSKIYMDDRNYGDTVPLLERASQLDPANADVQLTLGLALRGVGRLDDAEAAYRKALQLDPSNPAPHFNLGVLLGDFKKDYEGAVAAFNAYVQAGGEKQALALEYIGEVEKEKKRAEKRKQALEEQAKKEEERKNRERILEEADKKKEAAPSPEPAPGSDSQDPPAPGPAGDAPTDPPPEQVAPAGGR